MALARRDYLNNPDARAKMAETGQCLGHLANMVYGHRWAVETGYSKVEAMQPRTRSRSKGARLFCFLYALAIFNSWVMWGALLRMSSAVSRRLHANDADGVEGCRS